MKDGLKFNLNFNLESVMTRLSMTHSLQLNVHLEIDQYEGD